MKTKIVVHFLLFLLVPLFISAQELNDAKEKIIEDRVDFLLTINEGGDADFTTLFEQLELYYQNPINLNNTTQDELRSLGLLNDIQISQIFKHIEKNGKLLRIEELQSISAMQIEDIKRIEPFVVVKLNFSNQNINLKYMLKEGSSNLFIRYSRILEEQKGYSDISQKELEEKPNARYLGSPERLFTRYRFNYANKLRFGITAEKDPGEEFFQGSQANGFDFYSAHFYAQDLGTIKQIALGDFQAQFGQGLTFWSGLAFGRNPNIYTLKRSAPSLVPYSSAQENLFLRGGGITIGKKKWQLTLFYSKNKADGNITAVDSLTNEVVFSSISESGFHRTPSELEDKNSIDVSYYGGNLKYEISNFSIGVTAVYNQFGGQFVPNTREYSKFRALSEENAILGLDYNYLYKNLNLFGEISKSIDGGIAYTNGALLVLHPKLSLAFQNRMFAYDFKPLQSNAIGENTINNNESGTFIGFNSKLSQKWNVSLLFDQFSFEWLQFRTDGPSRGNRILGQIDYSPSKRLNAYVRFRQRKRGRNADESENGLNEVVEEFQQLIRFNLAYQVTKNIEIKSRIEQSQYKLGDGQREYGIVVFQDIVYRNLNVPISFSLRYAIFDTDSYDSRIYAYENDVLYAFSVPAYSGRGTRFYVNTKYRISRSIDLWLRYSQTYYADRSIIGSGKDEIMGNTRSEVKAQLRIKF